MNKQHDTQVGDREKEELHHLTAKEKNQYITDSKDRELSKKSSVNHHDILAKKDNDYKVEQNQEKEEAESYEDLCRICHTNNSIGSLYNPCKCTGSIKYIHQTCLLEWLKLKNYGNNTYCELCKHKFIFETVYSEDKPQVIPFYALFLWICLQIIKYVPLILRFVFITYIWCVFIPVAIAHIFYFCASPKFNFIENILSFLSNLIEFNEQFYVDIKIGSILFTILFTFASIITLIKETAMHELDHLDVTVELNDIEARVLEALENQNPNVDVGIVSDEIQNVNVDFPITERSDEEEEDSDDNNLADIDDMFEPLDTFYRRSSVVSQDFERTRRSHSVFSTDDLTNENSIGVNLEDECIDVFKSNSSDDDMVDDTADFNEIQNSLDRNIFNRRSLIPVDINLNDSNIHIQSDHLNIENSIPFDNSIDSDEGEEEEKNIDNEEIPLEVIFDQDEFNNGILENVDLNYTPLLEYLGYTGGFYKFGIIFLYIFVHLGLLICSIFLNTSLFFLSVIDIPLFITRFVLSKFGIRLLPFVLYMLRIFSNDFGFQYLISNIQFNANNSFANPNSANFLFHNNIDFFLASNSTLNNDVLVAYLSYCHSYELSEISSIYNNHCSNIILNSIKYSILPTVSDLVLTSAYYEPCINECSFNNLNLFLEQLLSVSSSRFNFSVIQIDSNITSIRSSLNFTAVSRKVIPFGPKSINRATEVLHWLIGISITITLGLFCVAYSENGWIKLLKFVGIYEKVNVLDGNLNNRDIDVLNNPVIQGEGGVLDNIWLNTVFAILTQCFNFVFFISLEYILLPYLVGFIFAWSLSDVISAKLNTSAIAIIYSIGLFSGLFLNYILTLLKRVLKLNFSLFFIHSPQTLTYFFSASFRLQFIQLFLRAVLQFIIPVLCISIPNKIMWELNNKNPGFSSILISLHLILSLIWLLSLIKDDLETLFLKSIHFIFNFVHLGSISLTRKQISEFNIHRLETEIIAVQQDLDNLLVLEEAQIGLWARLKGFLGMEVNAAERVDDTTERRFLNRKKERLNIKLKVEKELLLQISNYFDIAILDDFEENYLFSKILLVFIAFWFIFATMYIIVVIFPLVFLKNIRYYIVSLFGNSYLNEIFKNDFFDKSDFLTLYSHLEFNQDDDSIFVIFSLLLLFGLMYVLIRVFNYFSKNVTESHFEKKKISLSLTIDAPFGSSKNTLPTTPNIFNLNHLDTSFNDLMSQLGDDNSLDEEKIETMQSIQCVEVLQNVKLTLIKRIVNSSFVKLILQVLFLILSNIVIPFAVGFIWDNALIKPLKYILFYEVKSIGYNSIFITGYLLSRVWINLLNKESKFGSTFKILMKDEHLWNENNFDILYYCVLNLFLLSNWLIVAPSMYLISLFNYFTSSFIYYCESILLINNDILLFSYLISLSVLLFYLSLGDLKNVYFHLINKMVNDKYAVGKVLRNIEK